MAEAQNSGFMHSLSASVLSAVVRPAVTHMFNRGQPYPSIDAAIADIMQLLSIPVSAAAMAYPPPAYSGGVPPIMGAATDVKPRGSSKNTATMNPGPGQCTYKFSRGAHPGWACGAKVVVGGSLCNAHNKNANKTAPAPFQGAGMVGMNGVFGAPAPAQAVQPPPSIKAMMFDEANSLIIDPDTKAILYYPQPQNAATPPYVVGKVIGDTSREIQPLTSAEAELFKNRYQMPVRANIVDTVQPASNLMPNLGGLTQQLAPQTQMPGLTQTPTLTQMPALTQIPGLTQTPALTQMPGLTQIPGLTQTPALTQMPGLTQTPALTQMPGLGSGLAQMPPLQSVQQIAQPIVQTQMPTFAQPLAQMPTFTQPQMAAPNIPAMPAMPSL